MTRRLVCFCAILIATSAAAQSTQYQGVLRSEKRTHRTLLEVNGQRYELSFPGVNLYQFSKSHDGQRAAVLGSIVSPPERIVAIIEISSISYHPVETVTSATVRTDIAACPPPACPAPPRYESYVPDNSVNYRLYRNDFQRYSNDYYNRYDRQPVHYQNVTYEH